MENLKETYFCGIDIGSSATKVVVLNAQGEIFDKEVIQQGVGLNSINNVFDKLYEKNPILSTGEIIKVSTGYGRLQCKDTIFQKSEISCHAKGVIHLIPDARTIIDIGGQDSKVIKISPTGIIEEFVMNDKCAAGTGRFLDVMSRVLGIEISEMGDADVNADSIIKISNTCTVFAESEVISYLAQSEKLENIVAGIHSSISSKVASLAKRLAIEDKVVLTGGVAQNKGILLSLSNELNRSVFVPSIPQFTGALGAAIYAREEFIKNN